MLCVCILMDLKTLCTFEVMIDLSKPLEGNQLNIYDILYKDNSNFRYMYTFLGLKALALVFL